MRYINEGDLGFYLKINPLTNKFEIWDFEIDPDDNDIVIGVHDPSGTTEVVLENAGDLLEWMMETGNIEHIKTYYCQVAAGGEDYLDIVIGETPEEKRQEAAENLKESENADEDPDAQLTLMGMFGVCW